MLDQQKPLIADHRGYWGYRELTEEELKRVSGGGCGCGDGGDGGGGGADDGGSDADTSSETSAETDQTEETEEEELIALINPNPRVTFTIPGRWDIAPPEQPQASPPEEDPAPTPN